MVNCKKFYTVVVWWDLSHVAVFVSLEACEIGSSKTSFGWQEGQAFTPEGRGRGSLVCDPPRIIVSVMGWPAVLICLGLRQFLGHRILLLKSGNTRQTRTSWSPFLAAQSLTCPPSPLPVPFRETPSYAKRRRLAGPSGLASPRPLQRSASDINLKGEVQPAASPGPSLRSLPHQLLLQRLQEEKGRDRDGDQQSDGSGPAAGRGSQSKIRYVGAGTWARRSQH